MYTHQYVHPLKLVLLCFKSAFLGVRDGQLHNWFLWLADSNCLKQRHPLVPSGIEMCLAVFPAIVVNHSIILPEALRTFSLSVSPQSIPPLPVCGGG